MASGVIRVFSVLGSPMNIRSCVSLPSFLLQRDVVAPRKLQTRKKSHGMIDGLDNVDYVSSKVHSSHQEASLYVFEENEAVIKMIIKGRSPTMRHVSRTHRVALDWLFDRINLEPTDPNQVHRHQKSTRRHANQGKFHVCFLNISHLFQFYKLFWIDVEKNAKRFK